MTPARRGLSLVRLAHSFICAGRGIVSLLVAEPNAWFHLVATVAVLALGATLHLSRAEWCWIVAAIAAVWAAEAFNTAIECVTDLASPDLHPLAARAKDIAAGAVLIVAIAAAIIGWLVLMPHIRLALISPSP